MDNVRHIDDPRTGDDGTGRPPSLDDDAEQYLMAAILDSPRGYQEAAEVVDRVDIEKPGYRLIWDVTGQLVQAGQPSHFIAVRAEIERLGRMRDIGHGKLIDDLSAVNMPAGSAGYFAEKIAKNGRAHRARTVALRLRNAADDPNADVDVFDKILTEYWTYEAQRAMGTSGPASRVDALIAEMLDTKALDDMPALEPLLGDLLHLDTLARVIGPSGHMKSFAVIDFAGHIGTGRRWHGRYVRQGLVVYLVAEGSGGIRKRVRAWERHHGVAMEHVLFLPRPVQAMDSEWLTLIEACRRLGPALVIVDTQARVSVGVEENSAKELGLVIDRMEQLRAATRACILLIHHTGHVGDHGRGSTSAKGALQSELHVSKKGDRAANTIVTIKTGKQKDDEQDGDIQFGLKVVNLPGEAKPDGRPVTSVVLVPLGEASQASGFEAPEGTVDWLVQKLDAAKVPADWGNRLVKKWFIDQGVPAGSTKVEEVVRLRKSRVSDVPPHVPYQPVTEMFPQAGEHEDVSAGQTFPGNVGGTPGTPVPPQTFPRPPSREGERKDGDPICASCDKPMDPAWKARGYDTHVICDTTGEPA